MELSIIVVSYNTSKLLHNCLQSIFEALAYENLIKEKSEVIVVDNVSSDDSVEVVKKSFPSVKLIQNKKNLGFAAANNQALRQAQGEYILLLNSDTEVREDALINLLDTIRKDKSIAVVGGELFNKDGTIQYSVGYFPSLFKVFSWMFFWDDLPWVSALIKPYHLEDKSFYGKEREVDWVSGACLMVRRKVTEKIGGLDEKIFMYGEEVEWCYRIKKAGSKILYTPDSQVIHLKGRSAEGEEGGIVEEFKSILYFYRKHKPLWQSSLVRYILMFGALLRIFIFGIIGRYRQRIPLYEKAFRLVRR